MVLRLTRLSIQLPSTYRLLADGFFPLYRIHMPDSYPPYNPDGTASRSYATVTFLSHVDMEARVGLASVGLFADDDDEERKSDGSHGSRAFIQVKELESNFVFLSTNLWQGSNVRMLGCIWRTRIEIVAER